MEQEILGTEQAFRKLINIKGFAKTYGYNKGSVSSWKSGRKTPALAKMEDILLKCGAEVAQEKMWVLKNK